MRWYHTYVKARQSIILAFNSDNMIYHQWKHPPRGKTSYRAINHSSPESGFFLLKNQRVECLLCSQTTVESLHHFLCSISVSASVCTCVARVCVWGVCFYVWLEKGLEQSEESFNVLNCHNLELAHTQTQNTHLAWEGWLYKEVHVDLNYGNWWALKVLS